jgi:Fur family transcriptional regulator, ferric uptake regulator
MTKTSEDTWSERALTSLSEAGFRSGGGRRQVVDLLGRQSCALTALEIDRRLPEVGRATVYRALEQLESLGLIQKVDLGAEAAGYERVDPGGHHHHHIVCEQCGRVVTFEDDQLEKAIIALGQRPDFSVYSHDVTLRGECASCEARSAESAPPR